MHKPIVVSLPNLTAVAYCPCGDVGEVRQGDRASQNALLDSQAHFEISLKESWMREASRQAHLSYCPLCKTSLYQDEEYPDFVECSNHIFRIQETRQGTVLTLDTNMSDASQLVLDYSWDNRCLVVNCPGAVRTADVMNSEISCTYGHDFKINHVSFPFVYCDII